LVCGKESAETLTQRPFSFDKELKMADTLQPLQSPEVFAAYCENVKRQLQEFVTERITFLEEAHRQLLSLQAIATRSGNQTLLTELTALGQQAQHEAVSLKGDGSPLAIPADFTTISITAGSSSSVAASVSPEPAVITPPLDFNAARPIARPAPPPVPKTAPRQLEDIYQETEQLTEIAEAEGDQFKEATGLIRLKGLLCRQRALQAELAARDIQHWPLRQLLNYIRRRIDDEHGPGHYLIPLRAELWPTEAWPWNRLAHLYESLADAHDALAWYDVESAKFSQPERQELLESIAAHQTRLWRHLQMYFPRQNDEHQINFFRELCAIAEEEDVYLFSLQERCPDDVLEEKAEELPVVLEHLRLDKKNRAKREAALQELRSMVTAPDFGTGDKDGEILSKAVARCRTQGYPASSTALRALLMDWVSLLDESKEKGAQEVAKELQREAERLARKAEAEVPDTEQALSDIEQSELDAVRDLVRGKRCLFIGGLCKEEARQRLERELGLAELVWPSTNGTESVYKFESDIQNTDITVILIRFMRTGWGQARELAVRDGKLFVRLPAGYGLRQVVRQFHRQIVHAEKETPVPA
jgi:hypothetical protein